MEIVDLCEMLLDTDQLWIQEIQIESGQIRLLVESTRTQACCPNCTKESVEIHSHYLRCPRDLAWSQMPVVLHIHAKRFFCLNDQCPKRTFAERFPGYVDWYARRTKRVVEKQEQLGIRVCARTAEALLELDQMGISDTTLNRLIRSLPDPEPQAIEVLGVDDWAKRKGQRYGTILVDQQKGKVVDVLEDRTAETLAKWLKTHPEIKIVTRDRSKTYAEGIRQGAPQAVQVADRWHLLKNGSDTLYKIFQQEHALIQKRLKEDSEPKKIDLPSAVDPLVVERELTLAEQNRQQRIDEAQKLVRLGWTQKDAAGYLDIHPKTVRRYLGSPSPKFIRSRGQGKLGPFKPFILRRWNEGCHNAAQLFREIQPQGFSGQVTLVMDFARQLRRASGIPPKLRNQSGVVVPEDAIRDLPSLRTLTWWVFRPIEKRCAEDEQILEKLMNGQPKLQTTIALARDFAEMIRNQHADNLSPWMDQAKKSGYRAWSNFADSLQQDEPAIRAALSHSWSNGRTEGNVNRLKYLKRMMYGRAKDDLLRKRVLLQNCGVFT
jgi:transposase